MKEENNLQDWSMDKALRNIYIHEIIFVTLILVCFIGELLAEVADRVAMFYWLISTPVFFFGSLLSEKAQSINSGIKKDHLIRFELCYWGSAMIAVLLVFLMWHAESIGPTGASMSIHIILAHTMFLSGIFLGFYYYLVGTFLFLTAALNILMSGKFGMDLVILLPVIWLGFYAEKKYLFPTLKNKHDFINELHEPRKEEE